MPEVECYKTSGEGFVGRSKFVSQKIQLKTKMHFVDVLHFNFPFPSKEIFSLRRRISLFSVFFICCHLALIAAGSATQAGAL